jgi:hypothetical protein
MDCPAMYEPAVKRLKTAMPAEYAMHLEQLRTIIASDGAPPLMKLFAETNQLSELFTMWDALGKDTPVTELTLWEQHQSATQATAVETINDAHSTAPTPLEPVAAYCLATMPLPMRPVSAPVAIRPPPEAGLHTASLTTAMAPMARGASDAVLDATEHVSGTSAVIIPPHLIQLQLALSEGVTCSPSWTPTALVPPAPAASATPDTLNYLMPMLSPHTPYSKGPKVEPREGLELGIAGFGIRHTLATCAFTSASATPPCLQPPPKQSQA